MRKRLSIFLTIMLVFTLVIGCSSQSSTSSKVELTLWVAGNSEQIQNTFNSVVEEFNNTYSSEGLSAKVQYVPWAELQQKLTTSLAGSVGPDVFMHGAAAAAGFASKNQIEPLDRYFNEWEDSSDFVDAYIEAGAVNQQRFVIPIQGANRMMIYRTDIFKDAGVTVPKTWAELEEVSKKVVIKDGNRIVRSATALPTEGIDLQQVWSPFLWSNGGDIFNEDFTAATLNTPEAIEALTFYKSFFANGLAPISGVGGQGDQHPLGTGEIAFSFDGVWVLEQIKNYTPDAYDKIDIAIPPAGRGEPTTLVGSSGFFMNANSKHKDDAWKLMSFIGSKENIEKISNELKFLPVRKSLIDADFVQEDPLFKKFVELSSIANGKANPNIPQWTAVRDILARHLETVLYDQATPAEALKKAEEEINAELKK